MIKSFANPPLVLSLDTATEVSSIAIVQGERVLASMRGRVQRENSARVLQDIEQALDSARVRLDDIELFAVANGPGSFTGLRSGLATIKAFAATFKRPVAGVPTLHAIASAGGGQHSPQRVLAALPAGRGEVFAQLLAVNGTKEISELSAAIHVSPAKLPEQEAIDWDGNLTWAGGGAHAHAASIMEFARHRGIGWRVEVAGADKMSVEAKAVWTLAPPCESYAEQIAALGLMSYEQGKTVAAEDLQALYVRLSDAELNEKCRA